MYIEVALDNTDHAIRLTRMARHCGFNMFKDRVLTWIKSYLSDRKVKVLINGDESEMALNMEYHRDLF